MTVHIIGKRVGEYEGTPFAHLYALEEMERPNLGRKPVTLKCKPSALSHVVDEVDVDYDVDFNRYGQVVAISKH